MGRIVGANNNEVRGIEGIKGVKGIEGVKGKEGIEGKRGNCVKFNAYF